MNSNQNNSASHITIRPFIPTDSLEELTSLLNRAYKKLSDQGFRYLASHQDAGLTGERISKGQCFVAMRGDKICGTICYYSPTAASGHPWYDHKFVASYGQFAVEPELQNKGIGGKLVAFLEDLAAKDGAHEISMDTAEGASDLIHFYIKRGYRFVAHAQWKETNYRSILLSKSL